MKKFISIFALVSWTIVGTVLLSRWWYAHPDYFPRLPEYLWQALDKVFGAVNVDDQANVECIVIVALASLVMLVCTTFVAAFFYHARKKS